jgi:hypothetical protein
VAYLQTRTDTKLDLRIIDRETEEETKIAEDVGALQPLWRRRPQTE